MFMVGQQVYHVCNIEAIQHEISYIGKDITIQNIESHIKPAVIKEIHYVDNGSMHSYYLFECEGEEFFCNYQTCVIFGTYQEAFDYIYGILTAELHKTIKETVNAIRPQIRNLTILQELKKMVDASMFTKTNGVF